MFSTSCVFDKSDLSCYKHSFVEHATRATSLVQKADDRIFKFDYSIDGLIQSPFYKTIIIDNSIKQLLDIAKNEAKNILEPDQKKLVESISININPIEEDSAVLWFKNDKNIIYISPYFIRAVFINIITRPGFSYIFKRFDINKEKFADNRAWTQTDINSNLSYFENTFIMNFVFIIGHELAHSYLGSKITGDPSIDEYAFDCYSYQAALKIAEHRSYRREDGLFGSFTSILKRCYESNYSKYWGVHQNNTPELKKRFEKLIHYTESTVCAN